MNRALRRQEPRHGPHTIRKKPAPRAGPPMSGNPGARLEFTWDPVKAALNVAKHGVTFARAATVLSDPLALTVFDAEHSAFEERWFTLGLSGDNRLLAVSHTYVLMTEDKAQARIISAREASRRERRQYENDPA